MPTCPLHYHMPIFPFTSLVRGYIVRHPPQGSRTGRYQMVGIDRRKPEYDSVQKRTQDRKGKFETFTSIDDHKWIELDSLLEKEKETRRARNKINQRKEHV